MEAQASTETARSHSRLDGLVALVTGASRGIGASVARELHDLGARVVITSREKERADLLARDLDTVPHELDVRSVDSVQRCVEEVIAAEGRLDILVNNAGVNRLQSALEVDEETWDWIMDTNLKGPFFMSQAVATAMIQAECRGTIVNIASQAGLVALDSRAPYSASKSALIMLTRSLAFELARHDITVNAVAPTFVETDLTANALKSESGRREILAHIPLGRLAEPEDIAHAVGFLVTPGARQITGHTLVVDGGWTIS
ncbi:MAG: glucose 1-dehydrogenase [Actinobacteria bacterium]|nr:glucose 1-dehydrogenase [Actinomycetota bacterium]